MDLTVNGSKMFLCDYKDNQAGCVCAAIADEDGGNLFAEMHGSNPKQQTMQFNTPKNAAGAQFFMGAKENVHSAGVS